MSEQLAPLRVPNRREIEAYLEAVNTELQVAQKCVSDLRTASVYLGLTTAALAAFSGFGIAPSSEFGIFLPICVAAAVGAGLLTTRAFHLFASDRRVVHSYEAERNRIFTALAAVPPGLEDVLEATSRTGASPAEVIIAPPLLSIREEIVPTTSRGSSPARGE